MEARLEAMEKRMEELREAQNRTLEAQNRSFELFSNNLLRQMREMMKQHHNEQGGGQEGDEVRGNGGTGEDGERAEQRRFEPARKLDIPLFSGEDASDWLIKMERYFRVTHVTPAERMDFVTLALEGEALTWLEWWEEQTPFQTWRRFREDLLKRFQPGANHNPMAPLLEVHQTEDVVQYRREFETAARSQRNLGIETLMCIFMNGLKKEIQAEMEVSSFENLQLMMDKALTIEWRNMAWKEAGISPGGRKAGGQGKGGGSFSAGSGCSGLGFTRNPNWVRLNASDNRGVGRTQVETGPNLTTNTFGPQNGPNATASRGVSNQNTPGSRNSGTRRLSKEEWAERQRKGLCFM